MSKGDGSARANLRATRAQINNASASAQTRAFKARQIAKDKRDVEERKLRALQAAEKAARATPPTEPATPVEEMNDGVATPAATVR